jgi:hypothetical protein
LADSIIAKTGKFFSSVSNVEHKKDWNLKVLIDVQGLDPLAWLVTNIVNPIILEVICPEGLRELKPELVHAPPTYALNCICFFLR